MYKYNEVFCFDCNYQIGWATDCGPGPIYMCDSCKNKEEEEEEEEE